MAAQINIPEKQKARGGEENASGYLQKNNTSITVGSELPARGVITTNEGLWKLGPPNITQHGPSIEIIRNPLVLGYYILIVISYPPLH